MKDAADKRRILYGALLGALTASAFLKRESSAEEVLSDEDAKVRIEQQYVFNLLGGGS